MTSWFRISGAPSTERSCAFSCSGGWGGGAEEISNQMFEIGLNIDKVICAGGSTGTHAGLITGFFGNNSNIPVIGVNASRKEDVQGSRFKGYKKLTSITLYPTDLLFVIRI